MPKYTREKAIRRFWEKVHKTDDCWVWTGSRKAGGYGQLGVNSRPVIASRFSYELHYGPIPDGLDVCHRCDNPPCVRPDHLFLGTRKVNIHDAIRKGRFAGVVWSESGVDVSGLREYIRGRKHVSSAFASFLLNEIERLQKLK